MTAPHLFTRSELTEQGTRPERDPSWSALRRNVWVEQDLAPADDASRYLALIRASHATSTGDHVYSHESAAALLGIPILGRWPRSVHLICERRTGGRTQRDVVRHCLGLEHVVPLVADGMLVTSPARTAFDFALSRPFEQAVVVADAVLRSWPGAAAELQSLVEAYGRRRGWQRLRRVVRFADPRSASVGESLSRCRIDSLGFIRPDLQVEIITDGRSEFGDFGWEEVRGLGEFDGEIKYRLDRYRKGGTIDDVVLREKSRENRLRRRRPNFARWDWPDLMEGRLEEILLEAGMPKRDGF